MKKLISLVIVSILMFSGCSASNEEIEMAKAITRQETLSDVLAGIQEIPFEAEGKYYMGVYATVKVIEVLHNDYTLNDAKYFQ